MKKKTATYLLVAIGVATLVGIGVVMVATRPRIPVGPTPDQIPPTDDAVYGGVTTPALPAEPQAPIVIQDPRGGTVDIDPGLMKAVAATFKPKPQMIAVMNGVARLLNGRGPRRRSI